MASVRLGPLVDDIRGSVADVTFGRNIGGLFARERTIPTQPSSSDRDQCQAGMAAIMTAWSATLTQAQRDGWMEYGRIHLLPNKWGDLGKRPGHLHFLRSNIQRYRVTSTIDYLDAPTRAPAHLPTFTFTADASLNTIVINLPPANYPSPPNYSRLYAFAGHDISAGRVFYNGPWRYIGWNQYSFGSWAFDPWSRPYPWTLTATHHVYARLVFTYPDGAVSFASQHMETVVP